MCVAFNHQYASSNLVYPKILNIKLNIINKINIFILNMKSLLYVKYKLNINWKLYFKQSSFKGRIATKKNKIQMRRRENLSKSKMK